MTEQLDDLHFGRHAETLPVLAELEPSGQPVFVEAREIIRPSGLEGGEPWP